MSRDPYATAAAAATGSSVGGSRSPRSTRRGAPNPGDLPTVDRSPSRPYPAGPGGSSGGAGGAGGASRGSPLGRRGRRSGANSPEGHYGHGAFYRDDELASPVLGGGSAQHRSRSVTRPSHHAPMATRYQSLDRAGLGDGHDRDYIRERDREFAPIRDRSLERAYLDDDIYRTARQSPHSHPGHGHSSGGYIGELQHQNIDLQRDLGNLKKELELTNQKLGSSMHSIKTFWSPELKKERALRKEESAKYSLINDQLKLLNQENQVNISAPSCVPVCRGDQAGDRNENGSFARPLGRPPTRSLARWIVPIDSCRAASVWCATLARSAPGASEPASGAGLFLPWRPTPQKALSPSKL